MSERGDIWLSRGFSVTCILSAFIGALTVGILLGEPDLAPDTPGAVGPAAGKEAGADFYAEFFVTPAALTARRVSQA